MGVIASVVGLFLGLALAKGLFKLFDAVGFTLPNSGLVVQRRARSSSRSLLGILVTLLASILPGDPRDARAADRRGPRGRDAPAGPVRALPDAGRRAVSRSLGFAGLVVRALRPRPRHDQGAAVHDRRHAARSSSASRCSRRRSSRRSPGHRVGAGPAALGWPARVAARRLLARDNARRNPQRTASTAAALMIGLALVTLVATLAAGITQTFRGAVNDLFTGDYAITAQNNFSPIPIAAAEAAAKTPGVDAVGSVRSGDALVVRQGGLRDRGRPGRERT